MYLEKINLKKFRVLEDMEVRFQPPKGKTAHPETGNVVNVIAGVNGCGKTSLLDAIYGGSNNGVELFVNRDQITPSKTRTVSNRTIYVPFGEMSHSGKSTSTSNSLGIKHIMSGEGLLSQIEIYIRDFILNLERQSFQPDPASRTKEAIDQFNRLFEGVILNTKLEALDSEVYSNRPLFSNFRDSALTIQQLSDGEKQLYGRIVGLEMLKLSDSVILIDEAELGLHPAWQQKIMQIYSRIGQNNQFIVATHSPQIIASVPYQNRILLTKQQGKIVPIHCDQPPSGVDVNTILSEIMGAESLPPHVLALRQAYRKLLESRQENSAEALQLKEKLLNEEGEHSRFMQEMAFFVELRDSV